MLLKPEHISSFANIARRALQSADVAPTSVLLSRFREHRSIAQRRRPYLTPSIPSQVNPTPELTGTPSSTEQKPDPSRLDAENLLLGPDGTVARFNHEKILPTSCPGCGAFAQEVDIGEAGYYSRSRKAVKTYLKEQTTYGLVQDVVEGESDEISSQPDGEGHPKQPRADHATVSPQVPIPVCDRCHNLIHNSHGSSIAHPSLEDLADSIAESPFPRNHVYHVLDAADFPMSLIPSIYNRLSLAKPRTQNRRSQPNFSRKPSLSFIITRSDLLGPNKDMVDRMMPYFQSVLRSALGRVGENMRLGNVHLVSAKRGWWSSDIKDSIWERGGGNWMLGKFNVGKSNLFEVLFPKGSGERAPVYAELARQQSEQAGQLAMQQLEPLSESSLLPPPQPESPFPTFPLVSSLPGTTASPIRLPFGNNKGELVDLPGLERGNLEEYVRSEHKLDLVMNHRPTVVPCKIKPGQSLLLGGGLVRITPLLDEKDPSTILLAYPFVPIEAHVTSTEKAIEIQQQERESGLKSILAEDVGSKMQSAGFIELQTDVTKRRAGALLRAGVPLSRLPFQIFATDLLIEGVGWVELVCQVRRRRQLPPAVTNTTDIDIELPTSATSFKPFFSQNPSSAEGQAEIPFPQVEVFTPNGNHVSQRRCLGAWDLWNAAKKSSNTIRPRKPMKGAKRRGKIEQKAKEASG